MSSPHTLDEREPLLAASQPTPGLPAANLAAYAKPDPPNVHRSGPLDITRRTRWTILAGVWMATFLTALNSTLVATLLSSISSEFNASHQASWLGTAYLLATCTFTPLYGRLSNVLGRRGANQTALLFTAVGTLGCGLSKDMMTLVIFRFIAGIGGGGLQTTSSIIISDMYSMRQRSLTSGIAAIFNGLGMGLGGPLGGWISDTLGWRWAFLIQMPVFLGSFLLTSASLRYTTPGKGRSTMDVIKRIDYGGTLALMLTVGACLGFLSLRFNGDYDWHHPLVITTLVVSTVFFVVFLIVELVIAPEPVLAPYLLRQKVSVLVGISNLLVASCNFSVMYFFPMWFETVMLASAGTAGLHLFPNAASMSLGALFAGWMMHKTGRYKVLNVVFGIFPTIAALMIANMTANVGFIGQWITIIPLGFGNAVVLQTTLIALLASLEPSQVAVGTGFTQLFRGIGQVGGVAVSSAIFQSILNAELKKRIVGPGSKELIQRIRHSARLVISLPPDIQASAREAYGTSLRVVFYFAAATTFIAFLVRLPIPELSLDREATPPTTKHAGGSGQNGDIEEGRRDNEYAISEESEDEDEEEVDTVPAINSQSKPRQPRRLSTYSDISDAT